MEGKNGEEEGKEVPTFLPFVTILWKEREYCHSFFHTFQF